MRNFYILWISKKKLDLTIVTVSRMIFSELQRCTIVIKCIEEKDGVRFYPLR
jgi:hypothetical protein